ncbi:hypothetical protein J4050_12445 [Winogradskyella sp. DF17]|uniref:DUF4476 domain-containing protein n=1 Tax=Winogradskyella pelagia TaxID=2819984 RepID=A0ABS3T489_9FLAO|nr:hypothetical protein [Winogradskyella sp. DF17]MBO3117562.1 hypothetical protein [Winogradskyella sp. DF17]
MKTLVTLLLLFIGLSSFSQVIRNPNGVPNNYRDPTEQELERRDEKMEERKEEYVNNFLFTLEGDEFQKVLVKQRLYTYYDAKKVIFTSQYEHSIERESAIKNLDDTHFKDLEDIISENDMKKIKEFVNGKFDEKAAVKAMKKKKKKKKS